MNNASTYSFIDLSQGDHQSTSAVKWVGENQLAKFFSDLAPWSSAYDRGTSFGFVAQLEDNALHIRTGQLWMRTTPSSHQRGYFLSKSVAAGHIDLATLDLAPARFIDLLLSGAIRSPDGKRILLPSDNTGYSSYYVPLREETLGEGRRISTVRINGKGLFGRYLDIRLVDWELKATAPPFDSLAELAQQFGAGPPQSDACTVEVVALEVAAVDLSSTVSSGNASLKLVLAAGLNPSTFSLGYRVSLSREVKARSVVAGIDLQWDEIDGFLRAEAVIPLEPRNVLQCFACYAGVCHHQAWFADSSMTQNATRDILDCFDEKLAGLVRYLTPEGRASSTDFEVGVSWLLWMLGFQVAFLGGTTRTRDAPDLVALTPYGHVLVVECTTGLLKQENKVAKLHERATRIRRRLDQSGHNNLKVLPLIVSSLPRESLKGEADAVERDEIAVATREDIEEVLQRTIHPPNADVFFQELTQHLSDLSRQKSIEGI